ncbi:MAG: right-handed parallel beta-helix repeat-containing protein [Pirellulaceae bacterium]|nr:right-handed parallel beta-helix repeat-containing protein [Pirellulaceae bacterium]
MMRNTSIAIIVAAITVVLPARAEDIVVDPPAEGNANNALESALAKAVPGDRVVLRAGEYRLAGPVPFPRGGEQGRPITLCAAPDEYVALLGSVRLTGWQKHQGNIWKVKHPQKLVKGLYEDSERLTHPRPNWGKREDPPVSELKAPGTWTQDAEWIYLWSRESDTPDNHRIEASQHHVMNVNQPWIRVAGLHMLFGQNVVCEITADHSEVVGCEIAHCSNSVDNSYNAYFSGCSHSAFRNCLIHDSFYWGDHGSNSHTMSTINCGDRGPNFVDRCEIFNGGLGIGTKGAVRELVVIGCHIYDQVNGISISGERSSGPGAGKADRGHYLIWRNRISDCAKGVWISSGKTHENRVWGNLIERCGAGFSMRNVGAVPDRPHLANNIFRSNDVAVYMVAGRDGTEKISTFVQSGFTSHNNLFSGNQVDWQSPLTWGRNLDLPLAKVQTFKDFNLEQGSLAAEPNLDQSGRSNAGCPCIGKGAEVPLPDYVEKPEAWHIGLGPRTEQENRPEPGLTLSIADSPASVGPREQVKLRAALENESSDKAVGLGDERDVILTFHFRYRGGHRDKQELYRCRVELPDRNLKPGERLDLTTLPGWKTPLNGNLGDPFHLRIDTDQWRRGCRLRATARLVGRSEETSEALQNLTDLIRSKEVLPVELQTQ